MVSAIHIAVPASIPLRGNTTIVTPFQVVYPPRFSSRVSEYSLGFAH